MSRHRAVHRGVSYSIPGTFYHAYVMMKPLNYDSWLRNARDDAEFQLSRISWTHACKIRLKKTSCDPDVFLAEIVVFSMRCITCFIVCHTILTGSFMLHIKSAVLKKQLFLQRLEIHFVSELINLSHAKENGPGKYLFNISVAQINMRFYVFFIHKIYADSF